LDNLKRETGGGRNRVGQHGGAAGLGLLEHALFQDAIQAGLFAECEGGADLHTGCADTEGLLELFRMTETTGHPERQSQFAYLLEIGHIAFSVDRYRLCR